MENNSNLKKKYVRIIIIIACFLVLYLTVLKRHFVNNVVAVDNNKVELSVFVQDGCPHCINAESWLNSNPFNDAVNIIYYNLKDKKNVRILLEHAKRLGVDRDSIGTPVFIIVDDYVIGFSDESIQKIIELVEKYKQ
jgi:glutaredoxin